MPDLSEYEAMANSAVQRLLKAIPIVIRLEYVPKAKYIGQAQVDRGKYTISISDKFFLQMVEARKETIEHEVCHLVEYYLTGEMGHDLPWINLMQGLGYSTPPSKIFLLGDVEE